MASMVGDFLLKRLSDWGVRRVYGCPGDGIDDIMGAFGRNPALELMHARCEGLAASMAHAHARFTGELGVCLATSGPGAIRLLNGLVDAMLDRQPVLAIVGQPQRAAPGGVDRQAVDLIALFNHPAPECVCMATTPEHVRPLVDRAVRIAMEQRVVTCVIFPSDARELEAVETAPRRRAARTRARERA